MRQIKFRAWDEKNRRMISSVGFQDSDCGRVWYQEEYMMGESAHGIDWIPMQFTGLLDKNGKEIYEGDVVKIPDNYEEYGMMSGEKREVYFEDGGFRLKPRNERTGKGHWLDKDSTYECEVIGNIYENPELLK